MGNTSRYLRLMTNVIGIPLVAIWLVLAYLEVSPGGADDIESQETTFEPVTATGGYAVSAAHPKAVQVGTKILENGGNAYDAAIAVAFTLGVVEPYGSGIGGGGAMVVYDPTDDTEQEVNYIDYREVAPRSLLTPAMVAEELGFDTVSGDMPTNEEWALVREAVISAWTADEEADFMQEDAGEEAASEGGPFDTIIESLIDNPGFIAGNEILVRAADMAYEEESFEGTPTPRLDEEGNWVTDTEDDQDAVPETEEAPAGDAEEMQEEADSLLSETEAEAVRILESLEWETAQWGNRHYMEDFGIPGFLMGMDYLYEEFATLEMTELLEDAVNLALPAEGQRNEFYKVEADSYLQDRFYYAQTRLSVSDIPHFYPGSRFITRGDELIQEELARTLEDIQAKGSFSRYFMEELAPEMVEAYPLLSMEDFRNYSVITEREPSMGLFQDYEVYAAPEPLGGPVLIQALQLSELMDTGSHNVRDFMFDAPIQQAETGTARSLEAPEEDADAENELNDQSFQQEEPDMAAEEQIAEVEDFVDYMEKILGINFVTYQDRLTNHGDPMTSERARERGEELTSMAKTRELYIEWQEELERREEERLFDGSNDEIEQDGGTEVRHSEGLFVSADSFFDSRSEIDQHVNTSHFVIIDAEGRMVSSTNTLSNFFGSGEYFKGFFLNDQLSNFSDTVGSINEPYPERRPRSFMTPTIFMERGDEGDITEMIGAGSPGGARIPMMMSQVMINYSQYDMTMTESIERMPRFQFAYNQSNQRYEVRLEPVFQEYEERYGLIRDVLDERGYHPGIETLGMYFGAIQALRVDFSDDTIQGFADPRRGGTTDGGPNAVNGEEDDE
ncbi:gamma-glutamyltransferase [Salisediminibacterium selenitireducens]|uniref:Gamma-glutamyltranspeptidase n=1 Tax=Bacillus selenitireducens (strain ATCC 700615 / DSM 15326 / MLS10) TaxID=439292 RepID=D6Y0J1_BACIE|nr:gamma-glutamyltranspeptidase [[Bacillus] selenitireducens MLS10]